MPGSLTPVSDTPGSTIVAQSNQSALEQLQINDSGSSEPSQLMPEVSPSSGLLSMNQSISAVNRDFLYADSAPSSVSTHRQTQEYPQPLFTVTNGSFPTWYGLNDFDVAMGNSEWDSLFAALEEHAFDHPIELGASNSSEHDISPTKTATLETPKANPTHGLQVHQVDIVEAKCLEIKDYLRSLQTGLDLDSICTYISRDILVQCIQLYADRYNALQPILHLPTFDLANTSPILLVAMMLVGASYSQDFMPPFAIIHGAIHALLLMENSGVSIWGLWMMKSTNSRLPSTNGQ